MIAHARTLAPGKPVTHLITSHNHFDHTAGLRQAVAEGLTIVQRRGSEPQFRDMVAHAAPDFPDDLARARSRSSSRRWTSTCGCPMTRRRSTSTGCATTATWRTCWSATSPSERLLMEGRPRHGRVRLAALARRLPRRRQQVQPERGAHLARAWRRPRARSADADARAGRGLAEGRHRAGPRALQSGGREGELSILGVPSKASTTNARSKHRASPRAVARLCVDRARRAAGAAAPPVPDLEGGWVRIDVDGSGSFNGLAAKFPRAVLTPAAQAATRRASQARRAAAFRLRARPVEAEGRWRGLRRHRRQLHIARWSRAQLRGLPRRAEPRPGAHRAREPGPAANDLHGWTRAPALSRITPTAVGHSTGRYEAGALVVETDRPRTGQRHRGRMADARDETDRAVSRCRPMVSVSRSRYTWQDPKVYVKPHTLSDCRRAHTAGQLGVRVMVRLERSQSAALDRTAATEVMRGR